MLGNESDRNITDYPKTCNKGRFIIQTLGFEVFTAVVMKSNIFWDITPFSPLDIAHWLGEYLI
jgi:hypothetical protein